MTWDRLSFTLSLLIVSHDYLLLTTTRLSVVSVISMLADAISSLIDADRISLYVALDSCFSIYLLSIRVATCIMSMQLSLCMIPVSIPYPSMAVRRLGCNV